MNADATEGMLVSKALDDALASQVRCLFYELVTNKPTEEQYLQFGQKVDIALEARRTIRLSLEMHK